MPKAILEFNLPEESEEHYCALYGSRYRYAITEFDEYLRNSLKHGTLAEDQRLALQQARDTLRECMYGLEY